MSGNGLQFFLAFVIVLVLIGAAAWFARRFAANRIGAGANRGRMPRLAVIDAAAVDGRRRLVLVRRDNVEHLLIIGGPSDIVVEPNIVRATPAREQMPPRTAADPGWADSDAPRAESLDHDRTPPLPEMPPRPPRSLFPDEPRRPAPPPERRLPDPLSGLAPEPPARHEPPQLREPVLRDAPPRPMPRSEPLMPRPAPRPLDAAPKPAPPIRPAAERSTGSAVSDADKNLAEMAQRLEHALRRPAAADAREDSAPPVAPEAPAARPTPPTPRDDVRPRDDIRARDDVKPPAPAEAKAPFKSLEDEMASLLGRPKTPT